MSVANRHIWEVYRASADRWRDLKSGAELRMKGCGMLSFEAIINTHLKLQVPQNVAFQLLKLVQHPLVNTWLCQLVVIRERTKFMFMLSLLVLKRLASVLFILGFYYEQGKSRGV